MQENDKEFNYTQNTILYSLIFLLISGKNSNDTGDLSHKIIPTAFNLLTKYQFKESSSSALSTLFPICIKLLNWHTSMQNTDNIVGLNASEIPNHLRE